MSIGKRSNKDFLPILKFDARAGDFSLLDRVPGIGGEWETVTSKIEQRDFRAIPALDVLEVGWIAFSGGRPDMAMVAAGPDAAARWGDPPSDAHKLGVRMLLKMPESLGGGIRELMGTSVGLWEGVDHLHDDYLLAAKDHPGQLPIVTLASVKEHALRNGSSFEPIFQIAGFVARPPDLPNTPPASLRASVVPMQRTTTAKPTATAKPPRDLDDQIPF